MPADIYDGFTEVEVNGVHMRMRSNHLLVKPFLPDGETDSGILLAYQSDIPTYFAEVVAVSPPAIDTGESVPKTGDIVVYERYASERVNSPALGEDERTDELPMRQATTGLHWLNFQDVRAILEP